MFVDKKKFREILMAVKKFVPAVTNPPIYQNALFDFEASEMAVFATDTRRNLWINKITGNTNLCNPELLLSSFTTNSDNIQLEIKANAIHIKDGKRLTKLQHIDSQMYISIPDIPSSQDIFTIDNVQNFKKILAFNATASIQDPNRMFLGVFRFETKKNLLRVINLDGSKMIMSEFPVETNHSDSLFMVNTKEMLNALDVLSYQKNIRIAYSDTRNSILLIANSLILEIPTIEDNYPSYAKLFEKLEPKLSINVDDFLNGLHACSSFSDVIKLKLDKNILFISAHSERGETSLEIEADNLHDIAFDLDVSHKVLLESLSSIPFMTGKNIDIFFGNPYFLLMTDIWKMVVFPLKV